MYTLENEMETHSSILVWKIPWQRAIVQTVKTVRHEQLTT